MWAPRPSHCGAAPCEIRFEYHTWNAHAHPNARLVHMSAAGIGASLSVTLAEAGYRVTGIGVNTDRRRAVNDGDPGTPDCASALPDQRRRGRGDHVLRGDLPPHATPWSICVPTPQRTTGDPDISYIVAAAEGTVPHLRQGTAVVLESIAYPGTTSEVILPLFIDSADSLEIGQNLFLAFYPSGWTRPKKIGRCARLPRLSADHAKLPRRGRGILRPSDGHSGSGLIREIGRDGQAAGKQVQDSKYRPSA